MTNPAASVPFDNNTFLPVIPDAGIAWKKLSDSEKEPFMEMARKDKERYLKEMHERDLEALKEQDERRKAREGGVLLARERPKYISNTAPSQDE